MNCDMEYIDEEESPTKKRKTLIDQTSQQDAVQTVQECVGRYSTIKLVTSKVLSKIGTRKVVSKRIIRGIDKRRTEMRTQ